MTPIRRNNGFLAGPEARVLEALVAQLPRAVTPDLLSGLGLAGAVLAGLGFAQAAAHPLWWAVAILGLALNWAGDSLDGRLARHRGIARPCRGYLLDNGLDMLGYLAIAVGFAASGLIWPALPFLALALHFVLVNLAAARLTVTGILDLSAGPVGTTELRAIFAGGAALLALLPVDLTEIVLLPDWTWLDLACGAWIASMGISIVMTLRADIRLGTERDAIAAPRSAPRAASPTEAPSAAIETPSVVSLP